MKILKKLLLIIAALAFVAPVAATVVMSFFGDNGFGLGSYADLLFDCFIFYPMFWNSLLYAAVITIVQLAIIIPCAFGFSAARFRGKGALFVFYIILMMMPLQVTILPNYIGLRDMGLINTPFGIILPLIFSAFGVVVTHQYMKGINLSVIEATRLKTNSVVRVMLTAVVPQIRICIFAVMLFVFADSWIMVEQPMLFLKEDGLKTVSVFIADAGEYVGNVLFPATVVLLCRCCCICFSTKILRKGLHSGIYHDKKLTSYFYRDFLRLNAFSDNFRAANSRCVVP